MPRDKAHVQELLIPGARLPCATVKDEKYPEALVVLLISHVKKQA